MTILSGVLDLEAYQDWRGDLATCVIVTDEDDPWTDILPSILSIYNGKKVKITVEEIVEQ